MPTAYHKDTLYAQFYCHWSWAASSVHTVSPPRLGEGPATLKVVDITAQAVDRPATGNRSIVREHSRIPIPTFPLTRLLALMLVAAAVATLPICHPGLLEPSPGADARTITESRSIVETFSSPGRHLLHGSVSQIERCAICDDQTGSSSESAEGQLSLIEFSARAGLVGDESVAEFEGPAEPLLEGRARSLRGSAPPPEIPPPNLRGS